MARVERRLPDGALDHPDLPFKPPLPFAAAIAAGLAVHHWGGVPLAPAALRPVGITLLALSAALALWSLVSFRAHRTPVEPWKATKVIVDDGPYAHTRNPIYIGFALLQLGVGFATGRWVVSALVVVPAALIVTVVVPREERYLRRKFGAAYEDYCSRVGRWC